MHRESIHATIYKPGPQDDNTLSPLHRQDKFPGSRRASWNRSFSEEHVQGAEEHVQRRSRRQALGHAGHTARSGGPEHGT